VLLITELAFINRVYTARSWGTRWRSWLRHCPKSRKVAGSIPDDVIGIYHWHNPSGRTMALGSTQPLTEMSTRNFLGVKAAGASGWQPYHLHVPTVLKSGSLNLLEPSGPVQACNGIALPLPLLQVVLPSVELNIGLHHFENASCKSCSQPWNLIAVIYFEYE